MRKNLLLLFVVSLCVIQCEFAVGYKSEIEITPSPIEETTTKKSGGFFSNVKNFFRGTTTEATPSIVVDVTTPKNFAAPIPNQNPSGVGHQQKPPPLTIPNAPLQPLGPRPDTPSSSPWSNNPQQPPQWPQQPTPSSLPGISNPQQIPQLVPTTSTLRTPQVTAQNHPQMPNVGQQRPNIGQPNLPVGFPAYHPQKPQPSGIDLSYGGAANANRRQEDHGRYPMGLAPLTSTTSTTTPKPTSSQNPINIDLRSTIGISSTTARLPQVKDDFPPLPPPRRPSIGAKEENPVISTSKSPSTTPSTPHSSLPPAWNSMPTSNRPATTPTTTQSSNGNRVSFVPHSPGSGTSTTVRPGFQSSRNSLATDDEIQQLTENLYTKETSYLQFIQINIQGKTRSIDSGDEAPQPLLNVDAKALEPLTITKLQTLFNNYEDDTMVNEHVTPNERKEENEFLDAIMATNVMRQAMLFLQNKGIVTPDPKTHRDLVKELWFTQYSRGSGKIGSSGFEHVFVNEVKNGTIIGLHNWVYFAEEEQNGHLDYKGYIHQLDMGTKGKILKVRFTHNSLNKPVNTLFIGTSPELELALYTVCFKLRPDRTCPVSLGNSKFGIVTYSWRYRGKSLIGSAYPEI